MMIRIWEFPRFLFFLFNSEKGYQKNDTQKYSAKMACHYSVSEQKSHGQWTVYVQKEPFGKVKKYQIK